MSAYVLGIDVAKRTLDVALLPAHAPANRRTERPRTGHFPNTPEGIAALLAWLPVDATLHACLEATSTYGLAVATALVTAEHTVSVVNPYRIKHYAQSELQRSKTDRVDAAVIARFCRSQQPVPWTPPAPALQALQALVRRRDDLDGLLQQERNRAQVPGLSARVLASLARTQAALQEECALLDAEIAAVLAAEAPLAEAVALVTTIPGIGRATAIGLVAELGDLRRFGSARDVAAYAGLVPAHRQSGTSLRGKPRLSKTGSSRLRKLLFHPALSAIRHNPLIRPFVARLREHEKKGMVIVGAVMHKLIRLVYGVLRTGTPFAVPS